MGARPSSRTSTLPIRHLRLVPWKHRKFQFPIVESRRSFSVVLIRKFHSVKLISQSLNHLVEVAYIDNLTILRDSLIKSLVNEKWWIQRVLRMIKTPNQKKCKNAIHPKNLKVFKVKSLIHLLPKTNYLFRRL